MPDQQVAHVNLTMDNKSSSSTHCQKTLNKANDFIVVVGKNDNGILQSEKRLETIKTNI